MTKTGNKMRLSALAFSIALLVALAASGAVQAQTGTDGRQNTLTVLTVDSEDTGVTFIARWHDSAECNSRYAIYIDGVDTGLTSLPEGAAVSGTGHILAGTAESTAALMSINFQDFSASDSVDALSVSVFCGDASTGRLVAEVNDIPVDADSGRPVEGAYSGELTLDFGLDGAVGFLDTFDASDSGLRVARIDGQAQDEGDLYHALGPAGLSSDSETHSSISTTIADSGTIGSTFTITWVDGDDCADSYNLYLDNINPSGVGLPSGADMDSDGRVRLGAVPPTADPLQLVVTFSSVRSVWGGDHLELRIYCDDDTGRLVDSDQFPVDSTSFKPVAGTYSSVPGITAFQINGYTQIDFDPYKTHEVYRFDWNVGEADEATIKPVLNDGYSAAYYGSTKAVHSSFGGKVGVWTINYGLPISDADDTEDDFQFQFHDNDPGGTDMFRMRVSRGDYHTGHEYQFFVIRKAAVTGPTTPDYAENGTDAIGAYTISDPDRDYAWQLLLKDEEDDDDRDAFDITKNADGDGVLSFAFSPDYEAPTDSSSPPDNVYHTSVLGWEANQNLGYWYGNYYGILDVQVTVTDVDPE